MTRVPIPIKTPDHRIVGYLSDFDQFEAQPFSRQTNLFQIVQTGLHHCLHQSLHQIGQWLSHNPQEPRIQWVGGDQVAHPTWQVFDPVSQCRLTFETETEVRNWLEQRYYQ